MIDDLDSVFKALADPTRRQLLDRLHVDNGQTLGGLCLQMNMSRQAVSKHLALLEEANVVVIVWRGREKLHYLNPVPIEAIVNRWIGKYERKRIKALRELKTALEETKMSDTNSTAGSAAKPEFVYVTYIKSSAEKVWNALTDGSITQQYWSNHNNASDWKVGSLWQHQDATDSSIVDVKGNVVESNKPNRLVMTWFSPRFYGETGRGSRVAFDIVEDNGLVRLTVTHDQLEGQESMLNSISGGWPQVMSGLKTLLESGAILPTIMERRDGKWATVRFAATA